MALIAKERVPPKREQINIRLNTGALEILGGYNRFIGSSQDLCAE
jgi:hypothetical protein